MRAISLSLVVLSLLAATAGCGSSGSVAVNPNGGQHNAERGDEKIPLCTTENFPASPERLEKYDRLGGVRMDDGFGYGDGGDGPAVLLVGEKCEVVDAPEDWSAADRIFSAS